ncbi:MAG: DUF3108 domain-containing protein, partial [Burkholderiaceae bacterium]
RWAGVLLASILLHFIVLDSTSLSIQPSPSRNLTVVNASLHPAPAQSTNIAFANDHPASIPNTLPAPTSTNGYAAQATKSNPAILPITPTVSANNTPAASIDSRELVHYSINLPPSAELHYEVNALKKGIPLRGQSTVNWQSDGSQYRIDGATDIAEIGTRSFQSEGMIDQSGIAPLLYTEKSSNKSATNTHFQRERNIISFSSSTVSYPRQGGEQDRASIIWQLAGIGRGMPEKFLTGADFEIFVAGVRDGETWRIHVIAEEEIDIPTGKISTWHLVRTPRPGTYEQQLDIWLAPRQAWYPVKLRYTQTNGDALDMSLIKVSSTPTR